MMGTVRVKREVLAAMLAEARGNPAMECCGLLAGRDAVITELLSAPNALGSATAFEIAPAELFRLFRGMRDARLDHLGIYHSHPATDNAPSPRDLELAYYPEAAYFILSPQPDAPRPIRAFAIRNGRVTELQIVEV